MRDTVSRPKSARATIEDVAQRAHVSTATVSRVVNQTGAVAEETSARVQTAIAELHYAPHAAARGLANRRTDTVGFLTPMIADPFFVPLLRGIEAGTSEAGFSLLIHTTRGALPHARSAVPSRTRDCPLGQHNADGLLVFESSLDEAELVALHRLGMPMVLLHQTPPAGLDIPYVTFENRAGARALVTHLVEVHQCRRIAYLLGRETQEDARRRTVGYREALEAHGIPFEPDLVASTGPGKEVRPPVGRWLSEDRGIDAIFAADDELAVRVVIALRELGVRVPEDIAVVGFDDVHLAYHLIPALTTVRAPVEMAGYEAVRQLASLIRTGDANRVTRLPTELVIRRSCGCAGERDVNVWPAVRQQYVDEEVGT